MSDPAALYAAHLKTISERHDAALSSSGGHEGVVFVSGRERFRFLDDNPYPFAPNPHFLTWVPLVHHPECWISYAPGSQPRLIYYQPDDYWHLPPADPEGYWTGGFDLHVVGSIEEAAALLPANRHHYAFIGEEEGLAQDLGFGAINPGNLLNPLHYARACKTGYEIACLEQASRLGARAHRAAARAFEQGKSEFEIHLEYLAACGLSEAELPYTNIIALNRHGAVLHYHGLDRDPPAERRSFLIDAGGRYNGYASDITRTYAVADATEFADLIRAMDARQQQLVEGCTAGTDYRDLHLEAHRHVAELLADFGLVNVSAEACLEEGLTRLFFPHGLGHLLGLQVHDVGGFMAGPEGGEIERPQGHPFLRLTRTLEPGMVTTVEPGLYIIDPLLDPIRHEPEGKLIDWDRVERFRPFGGVRIEDDVLVTDGTPRNLTREAFAAVSG